MKSSIGLQDIQGLDPISWWPLAIGWWVVISLVTLAVIGAIAYHLKKRRDQKRWEFRLLAQLEQMKRDLTPENSQTTAAELAELVRRLAIHRTSRTECAHLQGAEWLAWLSNHDPHGFDWRNSSPVLVDAPFRPPGLVIDPEAVQRNIQGAKGWVK